MDRKNFFSAFFSDLLKGVNTAFGDELSAFAQKFPELIRPPGAGSEQEFLETCSKCGKCIKACPYFALRPVLMANEFDRGTPTLRTGESYCRFCPEFPCIVACPTGALSQRRQNRLHKIGKAEIIAKNCTRNQGSDCHACLDKCEETGHHAIKITPSAGEKPASGLPEVIADKCNGCGACLTACPAYPDLAISLKPWP
ncbi:MAG TPA: 4Fe-4S dicluster domain-containing protein [Candidatus Rifleibacterium sp.]|nr:4Fe-4S dicluster domain-containing protein [Candidatus Rifleibacterium sp.]HPW59381.1 4Fe-4S dicluster domain-containing protein [Candidatus Rifleibacterium sp.]